MRRSTTKSNSSWLILGMVMLSVTLGCRKHDPPLLAAKNLGSGGQPLLPSWLPQYNQDILKGRATPVRLAELPEEEEPDQLAQGGQEDSADGSSVSADDRDAIHELVGLIVGAACSENDEELGDYLVEEQRDVGVTILKATTKQTRTALRLFRLAAQENPQVASGIAASMGIDSAGELGDGPDADADLITNLMQATSLRMTGKDQAVGILGDSTGALPIRFDLIDGDWYLRFPELFVEDEFVSTLDELSSAITGALEDAVTKMQDGDPDVLTALASLPQETLTLRAKIKPIVDSVRAEFFAQDSGDAIAAEDRELIVEVADLLKETVTGRRLADGVEFLIPDQQDIAETVYPSLNRVLTALDDLVSALDEASNGNSDAIKQFIAAVAPPAVTDDLASSEEGQAVAEAVIAERRIRQEYFLIDNDWYIKDPRLPDDADKADETAAAWDEAAKALSELAGQIEDGDLDAVEAVDQIADVLADLLPEMDAAATELDDTGSVGGDDADPADEDADTNGKGDGETGDAADAAGEDDATPPAAAAPAPRGRSARGAGIR